jgi:hypothetical protein
MYDNFYTRDKEVIKKEILSMQKYIHNILFLAMFLEVGEQKTFIILN